MVDIKTLKDPCTYAKAHAEVIDVLLRHYMKEYKKKKFSEKRGFELDKHILGLFNMRIRDFMHPEGICSVIKSDSKFNDLKCEECYITQEYLEIAQEYKKMHQV